MRLAAHQPVYLPGLIVLSKIALADVFVAIGHVQYEKSSWQSRNRVRSGSGITYLSVPVRQAGRLQGSINETEIIGDRWRQKHLKTIYFAYRRRPYFDQYFPVLERLLSMTWRYLGELNMTLLRQLLDWYEVGTPIIDSRDLGISGQKTDLLISICRTAGADAYISSPGERSYVEPEQMRAAGICHGWQAFRHPAYPQGDDFVEHLSAIDLLFNVGSEAGAMLRSAGKFEPSTTAKLADSEHRA